MAHSAARANVLAVADAGLPDAGLPGASDVVAERTADAERAPDADALAYDWGMPDIDPKLVTALGAVFVDVVQWLLHRGQSAGSVASDDIKRIAAQAAQAAVEDVWASLREEGMVLATEALADAANRLLAELDKLPHLPGE